MSEFKPSQVSLDFGRLLREEEAQQMAATILLYLHGCGDRWEMGFTPEILFAFLDPEDDFLDLWVSEYTRESVPDEYLRMFNTKAAKLLGYKGSSALADAGMIWYCMDVIPDDAGGVKHLPEFYYVTDDFIQICEVNLKE